MNLFYKNRPTQADLDGMSHAEKDALVLELLAIQELYERKLRAQERKTADLQSKTINGPLWIAVALSIIAHILFSLYYQQHHEKPKPLLAEKGEKRIEVSLSSLPPAKSAGPQTNSPAPPAPSKAPQPVQAATRPKPASKPVKVMKPAPPKVVKPRPVKEPPKETPPRIAKPSPVKEKPVQTFDDPFAYKSHSFSSDMASSGGGGGGSDSHSGGLTSPEGGLSPGSIVNVNPRIIYPRQSMQRNYQGVVKVLIHIATDGSCSGVDLVQSSGHDELDNQVLGAVQHWRFTPPKRGNMPLEGVFPFTVVFGADEEVDFNWRSVKVMPATR
ncbi:energy transducer TonB [Candidatus Methylospira mobilis]|uniref:energy transducer TonB n=1 Tax=Candidatus Methylospira mobilis TaxID=1808979 RepID=UPI0028EA3FF4|nr:energy transducer TonB [Candidatus Methylospira mobilis]WNV06166.1 energy transducer TonB [Candidatus Methylospira mobilis]